MDEKRLPIKFIMPKQGSELRTKGGGGDKKPFRTIDSTYRERLSNQIMEIRKSLPEQIKNIGAAPIRVSLIPEAIAKTHRPEKLFSERTCPIIGAGGLGELFVKATPAGLDELDNMVGEGDSKQLVKELSTVQSIEPITPNFRLGNLSTKELLQHSPRGENGFIVRVRLFDFGRDRDQEKLMADFKQTCRKHRIEITQGGYSLNSFIYAVECRNTNDIKSIADVVGVRSIHHMPLIQTLRPNISNTEKLPLLINRTEYSEDVPVVVVVDSGISDELSELEGWVFGRESYVAPTYQNTDHGTFVAGLICWGQVLNPTLEGLNSDPCGVFDLQILPNGDSKKGDTDFITESLFLSSLETSLKRWANKYKVWNLSLSTDATCSIAEFSPLAEELDNLQEKYQVSFVISAGNYTFQPLLDYPRTPEQEEKGRITSPADSVLGITVGAISHIDHEKLGVIKNHPSAFSRNGSGPNYVIKPDLVHYGGACSTDLSHITGIRSINGKKSVENFGTSFSAPLVSRTLAQIYHYITPTPSPVLARALLTHHSRDPRTNNRVPDGQENCFGFGRPAPVPYCLECTPYSSTLVFEDELRPGYFLEWNDFPYPPSLKRDGRYYGEIWMTVAFAPARGARWGTEYCETHVEAHLGVYRERLIQETGEIKEKFHGLVPPEHKNRGVLYESYQVAKLRKWAPVRTYHGKMGDKGQKGLRWRLKLNLLTRHGIDKGEAFKPQPFSLIITIADPENKAPIYDEMSRIVRNRFQSENLTVRAPARIRAREQG